MRLFKLGLALVLAGIAQAGTSVIEIKTEGAGTITRAAGQTNQNGAMVWNGTEWVVNNTWAHRFFVDTRTGNRLKTPAVTAYQGNQPGTFTSGNYSITRSLYNYQKTAATGIYRFQAIQYRIHDQITGKDVVLRSRGSGVGSANAAFDIYIEDDVTGGGFQITAFRGDPAWFTYVVSMDQALLQTSTTANRTGTLSASPISGLEWFFLDQGGGGDLGPAGVGKSFLFHASPLTVQDPVLGMGVSFATDFALRWMDTSGNLWELQFLPWAEGTFTPNPNPIPAPPSLILMITGLGGAALYRIRKRRAAGKLLGGLLVLALAGIAQAGTTVIESHIEGAGTITKATGETNLNGAMVWDGSQWVVNNTYAHGFFVDALTRNRLKTPAVTAYQGNQPGTFTSGNYSITRSLYNYQKTAATGTYRFQAIQYRIRDVITGKEVVLRSRGLAAGTANPAFDIYIQDETTSGVQITAFRGDPAWFTYVMSMDQALLQTSTTASRTGTLSASWNGSPEWFFIDQGGGGDFGPAGVGKSFIFHASPVTVQDSVLGIGVSFATDFALRWMDSAGNLFELQFLPWAEGTFTPNAGPNPNPIPAPPSLILMITGGLAIAGRQLWRRRRT